MDDTTKICLHCLVEGRVQGVFYRDAASRKAKELNVTGWIRNLSDGRVEVKVCGNLEQVESFRDWLWDGPPAADVTDVTVEEQAWEEHDGFEVKK